MLGLLRLLGQIDRQTDQRGIHNKKKNNVSPVYLSKRFGDNLDKRHSACFTTPTFTINDLVSHMSLFEKDSGNKNICTLMPSSHIRAKLTSYSAIMKDDVRTLSACCFQELFVIVYYSNWFCSGCCCS